VNAPAFLKVQEVFRNAPFRCCQGSS
jgi:hypothetical protein